MCERNAEKKSKLRDGNAALLTCVSAGGGNAEGGGTGGDRTA